MFPHLYYAVSKRAAQYVTHLKTGKDGCVPVFLRSGSVVPLVAAHCAKRRQIKAKRTFARVSALTCSLGNLPLRRKDKEAIAYRMQRIAAFASLQSTASMGHKHSAPNGSTRSNHRNQSEPIRPNQQYLKGASRLVNPPSDEAEALAREEDPVERDYVGRLLHVADEALHHDKREHRKRRSRIH